MILYIPTCSLNINNILSSDSISPAAHYVIRKTGNKRFFPVEACPDDQAVFLYSRIPLYRVDDKVMENYRVVIALEANEIAQEIKKIGSLGDVDVYVCESTIYFNPIITSFLYEGKNAFQTCKIQSEQSIENKTFGLYKHSQIEKSLEFQWNFSYCMNYQLERKESCVEEDAYIDRIKGAIICYYAGLKQVSSPEVATLKKDARQIKNIFSAIANSANRGLSKEQESRLEPIIKEFSEIFSTVDPITKKNNAKVEAHLSSSATYVANAGVISKSTILNIIDELGLKRGLKQLLKLNEPFDIFSLYDIIGSSKFADMLPAKMAEMERAISVIEQEFASTNPPQANMFEKFSVKDNWRLDIFDNGAKLDFYNQFINSLIKGEHLENTDVKPSLAIALLGGQILKSLIGEDKWGTSSAREYINALLSNIQNGTPFDIISDDHDILQALAAFSLKGSDIDKLTDCLSQNGISEYRYAWGLYGAAYGYAQLPKTFTNSIVTKEVLQELYRILFPVQLKNCEESVLNEEDDLPPEDAVVPTQESVLADMPDRLFEEPVWLKSEEINFAPPVSTIGITVIPEEEKEITTFRLKMKNLRYGKNSKKSLTKKQVDQIVDIYKSSGTRIDETLISKISKVSGVGKEAIKALRDSLGVGLKSEASESLFAQGLLFVKDDSLAEVVRELRIDKPEVEKIILDDIRFVQQKHLHDSPQDNMECIKHLSYLLFIDNGKHLKRTPVNNIIVDQLIEKLRNRYR